MTRDLRIGFGYDTHTLAPGGPLRLGGVDVPSEVALQGHSDADALAHAITDALLGAAGLGDIGDHFPPSDEQYRGIDSLLLLEEALRRVRKAGWEPVNVDATVIAEAPKLGPFKKKMGETLARVLGLDSSCVNIKATTHEKMGCFGRGEGIAAQAVALLAPVRNRAEG
jgi:2-C-methyl-D-erythritol 2,4-cyclodiphosphate synthase